MHLEAATNPTEKGHGKLTAQVLAELRQPVQKLEPAIGSVEVKRLIPEPESEPLKQGQRTLERIRLQVSSLG